MLAVGLLIVLVAMAMTWVYQNCLPPPPKTCGSPGGPPITAPRIKLRDGRHLAYKEHGVPAKVAKYKIIFVHGLSACRYGPVILKSLPQVIIFFIFIELFYWSHLIPHPNTLILKYLSGTYWRTRTIHFVLRQTWLWRKWSTSNTNTEKFGFRYRRACRSLETRLQILRYWLFYWQPSGLGLPQVHSS